MSLIQRVSRILRNQGVEVDIELITNTTYRECIWRKSRCDIVMDECVTPSFHLSSLEGLALGKMTVCWVDDKVNSVLTNITGADSNPFHGDYIGWLEDILIEKLTGGREKYKKQRQMRAYNAIKPEKTTVKVNAAYKGERIKEKIQRIMSNKEPTSIVTGWT